MPDSKIHLFGSFFLLWRCFWLLITIFHRSPSLSRRSITSPITTFLLLRMRGMLFCHEGKIFTISNRCGLLDIIIIKFFLLKFVVLLLIMNSFDYLMHYTLFIMKVKGIKNNSNYNFLTKER